MPKLSGRIGTRIESTAENDSKLGRTAASTGALDGEEGAALTGRRRGFRVVLRVRWASLGSRTRLLRSRSAYLGARVAPARRAGADADAVPRVLERRATGAVMRDISSGWVFLELLGEDERGLAAMSYAYGRPVWVWVWVWEVRGRESERAKRGGWKSCICVGECVGGAWDQELRRAQTRERREIGRVINRRMSGQSVVVPSYGRDWTGEEA
jgi:hypothetical protein